MSEVYAGRIIDKNELKNSSSGGAFTVLSNIFLKNGHAILASTYDYDKDELDFKLLLSKNERDSARGSKYFQSNPADSFRQAKKWLFDNPDKSLLFVGMGCQAEGFRKYAEATGIRERVFIVDIICTGVPSPQLWKDYSTLFGKFSFLSFKDKRNGWKKPTAYIRQGEKEISIRPFMELFYSHNCLRPSCFKCKFAKVDRLSDITIGDFWHIEDTIPEFYNEMGTSLFIVHSAKGRELFEKAKPELEWLESNTTNCLQNMLERPTPRPKTREQFWNDYKKSGIKYLVKKYGQPSLANKIKSKIKILF